MHSLPCLMGGGNYDAVDTIDVQAPMLCGWQHDSAEDTFLKKLETIQLHCFAMLSQVKPPESISYNKQTRTSHRGNVARDSEVKRAIHTGRRAGLSWTSLKLGGGGGKTESTRPPKDVSY